MEYRVRYYCDDDYEVLEIREDENNEWHESQLFKGSLADCEAFIRLSKGGYI